MITRYIPTSAHYGQFYTIHSLYIYNNLPEEYQLKNKTNFKKLTKKWIRFNDSGVSDTFD